MGGQSSKEVGEPVGIGHTERKISKEMKYAKATYDDTSTAKYGSQSPKASEHGRPDSSKEFAERTVFSPNFLSMTVGKKEGRTVEIKYAYRSQRGFYPENPNKANQDKHGIIVDFGGEEGDAMFAVYDGHGENGHDCAAFASKQLPKSMIKFSKQKRSKNYIENLRREGKSTKRTWNPSLWPMLKIEEYKECCNKAFLETNEALHNDKGLDDRLSGTTAVTVFFHDARMIVCNVGDSRVLLGQRVGNEVLPIALTRDQTPYRKDERERVKKEGAQIKSIDQLKGREPYHENWGDMVLGEHIDIQGDPPRIWVPNNKFPGTAFTRSIGDTVAEKIGVMAEPEIVTKYLTADDKYLVIASDGIFELMTNTDVMNICKRSEDPVEACEMLTKTAYKTWLEHENRTDDITVIVCFLSSSFIPGPEEANETTKDLIPDEPAAKDVTAESDDPIEKSEENEDSGVTDCGTALCF